MIDTKIARQVATDMDTGDRGILAKWVRGLADEVDALRGVTRADDERLEQAAIRAWGEHKWGCDTAEHLADEVDRHRRLLFAAKVSVVSRYGTGRALESLRDAIAACEEKP